MAENMQFSKKLMDLIEVKKQQPYTDGFELICETGFTGCLTRGKRYYGYIFKKNFNVDGVRFMISCNDRFDKCDYPIRWFKSADDREGSSYEV